MTNFTGQQFLCDLFFIFIALDKALFLNQKVSIFFLFLDENICCDIHQKHLSEALLMSTTTYVFVE